jgi:hypothetical protein
MAGGTRLLQCSYFGVVEVVVVVRAFAENGLGGEKDTADGGIRRSECCGVAGEL